MQRHAVVGARRRLRELTTCGPGRLDLRLDLDLPHACDLHTYTFTTPRHTRGRRKEMLHAWTLLDDVLEMGLERFPRDSDSAAVYSISTTNLLQFAGAATPESAADPKVDD
eukprot:COSAG02_NODE_162_length_32474_cov_13.222511_11_plen_111_part_00